MRPPAGSRPQLGPGCAGPLGHVHPMFSQTGRLREVIFSVSRSHTADERLWRQTQTTGPG